MLTDALIALLLAAPAPATAPGAPAIESGFLFSEHVVVRIPLPRRQMLPSQRPPRWKESKGPRCINLPAIAGAAIDGPDSVDFVLKGGRRVRARLDHACPALDYYSGFYLVSPGDGRVCADRDSVHARSGGACEIERFRTLKQRQP